ncbi:MAG TPA: TIR domain-containing protein [Xanthobacteraceae bacterium]|nr:TIR domain-containing protein [Xanthobacteraceae bacterium]
MPAIFISHSSHDQKTADDITSALKHLGFEDVFLDFDTDTGIGAGADWEKTLYEKLSRCHALVLVLTPNWLASTWCRIELAQARALGKVILPIICAPLGDQYVLPEIQAVDLLDWNAGGIERLEQRLRAIASELARGFKVDPNRPPYPGIHAFEAEDAAIYFGRDDETRAVIERLDARRTQGGARFLVVIGASGSGKSSLLKAGVLPQLERRRREWVILPPIRPEKTPAEMLAKTIAQQLGKPDDWRTWHRTLCSAVAIDHIEELFRDLRVGQARAATVLLPIDQFEEVFTVATETERVTFLHLLASTLDPARDLPVMVIATGRSDVLQGLLEVGELAHLTETYPLSPMPLDRVPRLVEGPAAMAGLNVEKGLSEAIARDVESPEALPLLAHTLWLLYRRASEHKKLSLAEYQSLGDAEHGLNPIQNSVRLVADQAIGGLKPSEAELTALRDAFVPHLVRVRLDDGKRVRQPAQLSEVPRESLRLVLALVAARLLTSRGTGDREQALGGGDALVEVSHEALFKAWPTLAAWLDEEQAFLADIERIKGAHDIWMQAADDQKARALLAGLLLSRARDWLLKYPQRFLGREMAALRAFIAASAEAEDAEKIRIAAQEIRTRRIERRMFQGAIAAAIFFFSATAFSGWQYFAAKQAELAAEEQRGKARERAKEADAQRDRALLTQSRFLADLANQRINDDPSTAMLLALEALPDARHDIARPYAHEAEAALFSARRAFRELRMLQGHKWAIVDISYSSDGQRIVTASPDKTARIWDAVTSRQLAVLGDHESPVWGATFSPDGRRVITHTMEDMGRLWSSETGKLIAPFNKAKTVAFSSDNARIVTTTSDRTARLWDAETGKLVAVLAGHEDEVTSAAFSPDGRHVVTVSKDQTARLWDAASNAQIAVLKGHDGPVTGAAFERRGRFLATWSDDNTIRLWNADTGDAISVLKGHEAKVSDVAFSPDGARIATASYDKTARLWDVASGKAIAVLKGHTERVVEVAFSPNGGRLATASDDRTARLWDTLTQKEIAVLAGHTGQVSHVAFSPDGTYLVTSSFLQSEARLWDGKTGERIASLRGGIARFSPDGQHVLTAYRDGTGRIWDVVAARDATILQIDKHTYVSSAIFTANGRRVVTRALGGKAQLWDADTGKEISLPPRDERQVPRALSSDGRRVLTTFEEHTARLWNAHTGRPIAVLGEKAHLVSEVKFSPDGTRALTASWDGTARVWDAGTGASLLVLRGHEAPVADAEFSSDGRRIVTASWDGTGRVWDAQTAKEIAVLSGHEGKVEHAAFTPDGRRIVTRSSDRTARIWDAESGRAIAVLSAAQEKIASATFSQDGRQVQTVSEEKTAQVWSADTGEEIISIPGQKYHTQYVAFSPDGKRIATGSSDEKARLWDVNARSEIAVFEGLSRDELSFSPNGHLLAIPSSNYTMRISDSETGTQITILKGHTRSIGHVRFSPDSSRVVTASYDGTARIWDTRSGKEIVVLRGHEGSVWRADFSADASRVTTTSSDGTARIWDAETGQQVWIFPRIEGDTWQAFTPDGQRVLTISKKETARIWEADTGNTISVLKAPLIVRTAVFSPSRERVMTVSNNRVQVWSTRTGDQLALLEAGYEPGDRSAFSPDGRFIVLASGENARAWNVSTGQEILPGMKMRSIFFSPVGRRFFASLSDGESSIRDTQTFEIIAKIAPGRWDSGAFTPDGRHVATIAWKDVAIWETETGHRVSELIGHSSSVNSLVFTADNARVLTGSYDRSARLWDVASGKEIATIKGLKDGIRSAGISDDGRHILTASWDDVRIWPVYPMTQDLVDNAERVVLRCLSRKERAEAFLDVAPPLWCIDMDKWPYHTQEWKDWLKFKRANLDPPLPDTPEWGPWLTNQKSAH